MARPYEIQVNEIINEELTKSNVVRNELPKNVQEALSRIAERLSYDVEHSRSKYDAVDYD